MTQSHPSVVVPPRPALSGDAMDILRARVLVDGFEMMMDLDHSQGCRIVDSLTGRSYLDFYSFYASQPIGYNHPRLRAQEFRDRLATAATTKVANADVYTHIYANFVQTFDEVAGLHGFHRFFFIDGGALAVENALKAAFDWKVRKNLEAGRGEMGTRVIHFKQCFHGRTGYTMSMTDAADPRKTMYFPKFDWPRVSNPKINFELDEPQRTEDVAQREQQAISEIQAAIAAHPHDIAAICIEPIQGEGGDNHFRPEFCQQLHEICHEHDILLIFDEVQTGMGVTGTVWACEQMCTLPDLIAFGKKAQVCGVMAGPRLDEVENVFTVSSRINSTWGGNTADMLRSTEYLNIIRDENLVENAAAQGKRLLDGLLDLRARHASVTNVRGRGLFCAFDMPDDDARTKVQAKALELGMIILTSGERSVRFRPVLDVTAEVIDEGLSILDQALSVAD